MSQYEDLLIDALLDYGFTLDEAVRLIKLQERSDSSDQGTLGAQAKQAFQRQCRLWLGDDCEHNWN